MGLLAHPSRLDRGGQAAQVRPGRQVGKIVFLLSRCPKLADEPGLVSWKMLLTFVPYPLRRSVGRTHTDCRKPGFQPSFCPAAPTHSSPLGCGQHVFGRYRENIGNVPLTGPAPNFGIRPNEPHANRVHLEVTGDANSPGKLASRKPLTERRTEPVTGV